MPNENQISKSGSKQALSQSSASTGSAHPWHARPRWQKCLHGFASYQLAAFASLIWPEAADHAMHKTLNDQFGPNGADERPAPARED